MEPRSIEIFDTTLRDGAQGEGISFSLEDKLNIAQKLCKLGIAFVEAGNPGSNPKDMEFFRRAGELVLGETQLVAFGSTRKKGGSARTRAAPPFSPPGPGGWRCSAKAGTSTSGTCCAPPWRKIWR